jgi:purine-nucleoside phosphorylase
MNHAQMPFETVQAASASLVRSLGQLPDVAIVLGSGLGSFAEGFQQAKKIPFGEVPGMPSAAVAGHAGCFVSGVVAGRPVLAMQGRVHLYEGHALAEVVLGVRALALGGVKTLILTNAAGGISTQLTPGALMLIDDHLNLTGHNPLIGPNDARFGERFPDMSEVYNGQLKRLASECAARTGVVLMRGVYAGVLGPSYETPAEIRMLRTLGASAVGMSTVLEAIAARHMGMRVLGMSCITNLAAGISSAPLTHHEVQETAAHAAQRFTALLSAFIEALPAKVQA